MKTKNSLMILVAIFGLATIVSAQVPSYVPTNGLLGWWPFNGNANDESGNENNGTVNGPILSPDRFGITNSSYLFDRNSLEYIDVSNTSNLENITNATISFWFNISTYGEVGSSGHNHFINKSDQNNQHQFIVANNFTGLYFYYGGGNNFFQTDTLPPLNQWNNLVITYNYDGNPQNSKCIFYINGALTDTFQTTLSLPITNYNLRFGSFGNESYNRMDGNIDDICIWDRALTQQEITDLYYGCQLSVIAQPINQSININNNAQFTTSSSDPLSTYQWQTDLGVGFQNLNSVGQYSGTTNDTLNIANVTMSNNNQPFRCIVSSGACSDTSAVAILTVNNNVGLNEFDINNLFSVYPNPAHSQINVKAEATLLGSIYAVYDNTGKMVLSGKINSENTVIQLGNLSVGIYIFSLGGNMKQAFKLIKE